MKPLYAEGKDSGNIPLWGKRYEKVSGETDGDKKIREKLEGARGTGKDWKGEEVSIQTGDMSFSLVRISLEDRENMERFACHCDGSPEEKYGVVWRAGCLEDRYVFDTWEYAAEFIVMGMGWE